ncbi:MAG: hypothetical protein ABUS79_23410, partial [Pseudomonadota bacterium]
MAIIKRKKTAGLEGAIRKAPKRMPARAEVKAEAKPKDREMKAAAKQGAKQGAKQAASTKPSKRELIARRNEYAAKFFPYIEQVARRLARRLPAHVE